MGYLEMAKLAGVAILMVVVLAVCGHYVYTYKHNQDVIAQQRAEIDSLKSQQEVLDKNQKETQATVDKLAKIKGRASGEKNTMQQDLTESDPGHYVDFTRRYRVRSDDQGNPPKNAAGAGNPKGKAGSKALPAPN